MLCLTRAIQHTHMVSPVHGWSDHANGYHTLKRREVQFHGTAQIPTDAAAMLDWGLDTPFMSQDRPPLAIAMTATVDGIRGIRRYRLVIAQKAKLRLSPEVATALASRLLIIVLLPVDSSRAPLIESSCMAMLRMVTDHPCRSVLPTMEIQCLYMGNVAQYSTFIRPFLRKR